jgi:hypothetical protein
LPTATIDQNPFVTLDPIVTLQLANRGILVTKCRKLVFKYWHRGLSKVINVRHQTLIYQNQDFHVKSQNNEPKSDLNHDFKSIKNF